MSEPPRPASTPRANSNRSDDRAEQIAQALAGALTNGVAAALGLWGGAAATVAASAAGAAVEGIVERQMLALLRLCEYAVEGRGEAALRNVLTDRPERASLVLDASDAMARSYEGKFEAIARAIGNGMLYEDDVRFDVEEAIVRTIMALDRPHVAVLIELGDDYLGEEDLRSRLPQYASVLPAFVNRLRGLGLTQNHHQVGVGLTALTGHKVTELGREVRQRFQSAAEALREV